MADLILYTGPMFSSKTTKLLMEADKRHYQKQKCIAFKSKMDDRYSNVGEIVTHNFNKLPAHLVDTGEESVNFKSQLSPNLSHESISSCLLDLLSNKDK